MATNGLHADYLLDRRRLRRKVSLWRLLTFFAVIAAIAVAGWRFSAATPGGYSQQIARVNISGVITGDRNTLELIERVRKADTVKAVILSVESPGGTTTGSERLYDELRRLSQRKPVVAVVGTMAASGAYIAALGADRIMVRKTSLVGSIGVLFQYPNLAQMLDKIGVSVETIKSSPLKAAPNGLEPTSPEARAAIAAIVSDSYDWFKQLVRERRSMDDAQLARVSDGRVFTGRQSIELKLVDQIGGEREAIAWLETEKKVAKNLPVRDWKPRSRSSGLGIFSESAARWAGLEGLAHMLRAASRQAEVRSLDGLVAIWHGDFVK